MMVLCIFSFGCFGACLNEVIELDFAGSEPIKTEEDFTIIGVVDVLVGEADSSDPEIAIR